MGETFKGYELETITGDNIDDRKFPGVTHLLHRDGSSKPMSIIMLDTVIDMIKAGRVTIPVR